MKKLLIFFCFSLIASSSYGQTYPMWRRHSPQECIALIDSILQGIKHEYRPDSLRFPESLRMRSGGRDTYYLIERDTTAKSPKSLAIVFKYYMEGANESLEIEGTPTYKIDVLQGPYLDLSLIWLRYLKPDADLESTLQFGRDYVVIGPTSQPDIFIFRNSGMNGIWKIHR